MTLKNKQTVFATGLLLGRKEATAVRQTFNKVQAKKKGKKQCKWHEQFVNKPTTLNRKLIAHFFRNSLTLSYLTAEIYY